jgi:hypothetical protein
MPFVILLHGKRLHFNLIYINKNGFCVRIEPHAHSTFLYNYSMVDSLFHKHFGLKYHCFYGEKTGAMCIEDAFGYLNFIIETFADR